MPRVIWRAAIRKVLFHWDYTQTIVYSLFYCLINIPLYGGLWHIHTLILSFIGIVKKIVACWYWKLPRSLCSRLICLPCYKNTSENLPHLLIKILWKRIKIYNLKRKILINFSCFSYIRPCVFYTPHCLVRQYYTHALLYARCYAAARTAQFVAVAADCRPLQCRRFIINKRNNIFQGKVVKMKLQWVNHVAIW